MSAPDKIWRVVVYLSKLIIVYVVSTVIGLYISIVIEHFK